MAVGPIGLILSTPLTLCLVVLGRYVKRLEFLDVMLGDRPALTPVESFYQRILAGDADEAEDHAERLLKACSLSSYYDEVALKALQLAANDAQRGVVDHAQLDRIKATVKVLVAGLADHGDTTPPPEAGEGIAAPEDDDEDEVADTPQPASVDDPAGRLPPVWRSPDAVFCVAGRGPLDEAAASMLQQLLGKHGMGARLVGYEDVSRDAIGQLEIRGVAMVCISYLDISGSPAHLRYLIRRLRERLPLGTPILVSLWPSEDAALKDKDIQRTIGADYDTSSLAEAVSACGRPQMPRSRRPARGRCRWRAPPDLDRLLSLQACRARIAVSPSMLTQLRPVWTLDERHHPGGEIAEVILEGQLEAHVGTCRPGGGSTPVVVSVGAPAPAFA